MSLSPKLVCVALALLAGLVLWSWERVARPAATATLAVTAAAQVPRNPPLIAAMPVDEAEALDPAPGSASQATSRYRVWVAMVRAAALAPGDTFGVSLEPGLGMATAVVRRIQDIDGVRVIGGDMVGGRDHAGVFELRLAVGLGELDGVLVLSGATYLLSSRRGLGWMRVRSPPGRRGARLRPSSGRLQCPASRPWTSTSSSSSSRSWRYSQYISPPRPLRRA